MNFWHMQMHPDNKYWGKEKEVLEETGYIGLGDWKEKRRAQQLSFQNDMNVGDIVAIKRGEKPIALVKVTGKYEYRNNPNKDFDWFERRRKVEILDWYHPDYKLYIAGRKTLTKCDMTSDAKTNKSIKKWYGMAMDEILIDEVTKLLKYKFQIILQGPPGTGKTRLARLIAEHLTKNEESEKDKAYKIIQFHPAYTYEDFVRGVVAKTNEDGNIHYKVENKILAQFAKLAIENPNSNYVLIIDEINRANLPSVLGELIYALEYRGEPVESMYELLDKDADEVQSHTTGRNIILPKNLYIIGTMNTADRSVGHIDYAIRRRFAFYDVPPSSEVIKFSKAQELFRQVSALFNNDSDGHLSSDFNANDVQLGHSYFMPSDEDITEQDFYSELKDKLAYEIKPILLEYIKDGVLLDSAREVVEALDV